MSTTCFALAAVLTLPSLALAQAPGGTDPRAGKGFIATPVFPLDQVDESPAATPPPSPGRTCHRDETGGDPRPA